MTTHPIDRARARFEDYIEEGMGYEPSRGEAMAVLDALAAAEHRATRAEAQSEARRINAEYWEERARIMGRKRDAGVRELADVQTERNNALTRIKAVEDVLDRHSHYGLVEADDIRRALDGTVTPRDAG